MKRALLSLLLILLCSASARAHRPSDSYLSLERGAAPSTISGSWDIALRDLDYALEIDDGDGALTWRELAAREADCTRYALAGLRVTSAAGPCAVRAAALQIVELSDGAYVRLPLAIACPSTAELSLDYDLLGDLDRDHRAIVRGGGAVRVAAPAQGPVRLPELAQGASAPGASVLDFVGRGVMHIFAGLDHVLFLLVLLLPCVLRRGAPGRELRPVLREVIEIVSAFTLAHSLTLSLAALSVVRVSAAVIEPAIAASVALAALNNLVPLFAADRWAAALALGLLHGFGFSSALGDAGLSGAELLPALAGFNLGVELGQLAIVACFVPLALLAKDTRGYRTFGLRGASLVVLAVSLFWLFERLQVG